MALANQQAPYASTNNVSENGVKDSSKAPTVEEYVGNLLSRIQPAAASEYRRRSVAQYVQDAIAQAFQPAVEVKAFTYGSVPLKTYLPDGDIDLAIFQNKGTSNHLKETWFSQLSAFLQRESINQFAPFRVRDVQVIHAEVKLVKCLVDNIVVDISFQSLGGLCTVNFLESIDRRIDNHHLFKRSIILVKAWCYYESRLLGAHHGLISTYALETMVLYIFMVFHKSMTTPLKVLHKFLTVFSKFDWEHQCLSLRGPIPLSTFPNPKPLPFPDMKDPPLLKEDFMADMRHMYSPQGFSPETASATPRAFQLKFLNIMDPLLPTNNLGRSVNKSNFARVRRALEYGANRLTAILEMEPSQDMEALKSFFQNTWNAQRSQVPVASGKMHKQQPATASGMEAQRAAPAAHTGRNPVQTQGQKPANGASGFLPQQSMSLPNGWQNMQGVGLGQHMLHPQQVQHMMMQQQGPAMFQMLPSSMSLDSSHRYLPSKPVTVPEKHGEPGRPWSAQVGQDKQVQGHTEGPAQKQRLSQGNGKLGAQQPGGNSLPSKKSQPGKPIHEPMEAPGSQGPSRRQSGTLEERVPLSNGASHREAVQQQMYHAGLPHAPMYTAMLPGMPQRLHPIVSSLQMGNGYSDFFKLPYPFLVQNGSLYNPRIPAGYAHASTGTNGHAVNGAAGKLDQRHGDSAVSSSKAGDQDDVILSGNLEQLSQHLQSATAMFNSQSAPATSRGPPYSNLGENGHPHHAGGGPDSSRPPTRSSSMGSLNPSLKPAVPSSTGRRPRQESAGTSFDASHPQQQVHAHNGQARPRFAPRQQSEYLGNHRSLGYEHLHQPRPGSFSDRGSSQPSSPGLRQLHTAQMAVPNPFNTMAPAEWPLLNGKARLHAEYPEAFRWGSQSESHSGWASPANSVVSEQSLASLKAMRANGSSPTPPSPLPRGISPKAASDAAEAVQREVVGNVPDKEWREDFVLAEEDFPGLPSSTPQSRTTTPTKDKPRPLPVTSWRPDAKLAGIAGIVQPHKASSEPVR